MILALALAALEKNKSHRPRQMFLARENRPVETTGYENILRVVTRQHKGSSEINGNTEEVIAAPSSSPAGFHFLTGGTSPGSIAAPALSFQLRDTAKPGAIGTAAAGGRRQPSTRIPGEDA